jgi:hypothetical protein
MMQSRCVYLVASSVTVTSVLAARMRAVTPRSHSSAVCSSMTAFDQLQLRQLGTLQTAACLLTCYLCVCCATSWIC